MRCQEIGDMLMVEDSMQVNLLVQRIGAVLSDFKKVMICRQRRFDVGDPLGSIVLSVAVSNEQVNYLLVML